MKEMMWIHLGQAGIQSGQSTWDLLCREHGCGSDGLPIGEALAGDWASTFSETDAGKIVPRCVLIDLDPDTCDGIRRGPARGLYHPDQIVAGHDDAASNYARARFALGPGPVLDRATDQVRRQAERSDRLGCVVVQSGLGGGTGSGLGALLVADAVPDLGAKLQVVQVGVSPSAHSASSPLEPYNAVLGLHGTLDWAQMSLLVDNRSLYDLATRNLSVDRPSYVHINRLIAQVQSSITASGRLSNNGALNLQISDLQTNLVPYPRLHFPIVSYAPVVSAQVAFNERLSVQQITTAAFERTNQMIQCDPSQGRYLACALMYRGDVSPKDVNAAVAQLKSKRTMQFVDWCPTGFKVGIHPDPPTSSPDDDLAPLQRSVLAVANTTAIATTLSRVGRDFDRLYERSAFVHWYVAEGMDKNEFQEAREDLLALQNDYQDAAGGASTNNVDDDIDQ